MRNNIRAIRRACLLAEVGRLKSRAGGHPPEPAQHSLHLARDHLDDQAAGELIEQYHGTIDDSASETQRRAVWTVRAANTLASPHNTLTDPTADPIELTSVFDPVAKTQLTDTYDPSPLSIDRKTLFPTEESHPNPGDQYDTLWNELTDVLSPGTDFETLLNILQRYIWCVPAFPDTPSLPLFDHCRTAAAIGEALARSGLSPTQIKALATGEELEEPCFTLVKGDLSGIQLFLHRMKNGTDAQDRIAKRMRGRSTLLWVLTESLRALFVDRMDLSAASVIWSGGGQFYAVVPPTAATLTNGRTIDEQLDAFEAAVGNAMFERFDANLSFVLGRAETKQGTFRETFERVAQDCSVRKLRSEAPFAETMESVFLDGSNIASQSRPCTICGGQKDPSKDRCGECELQEEIGRIVPKMTQLGMEFVTTNDSKPRAGSERVSFEFGIDDGGPSVRWTLGSAAVSLDCDRVYSVNETAPDQSIERWGFVLAGVCVPHGGGIDGVWSFPELADFCGSDQPYLHAITMDIDDLGSTIDTAMDEGPARLSALGRGLTLFFEGYLNELAASESLVRKTERCCPECADRTDSMEKRMITPVDADDTDPLEFRKRDTVKIDEFCDRCVESVAPIYIGFAGGDDLLFVGGWDIAAEFAQTVHKELQSYASGSLTISAGCQWIRPKYPIGRAIEQAEERLSHAKSFKTHQKNSAWLFGSCREWTNSSDTGMYDLIDLGNTLALYVESGAVSQSLLHALLSISTEFDSGPPTDVKSEWAVKYALTRAWEDGDSDVPESLEEKVTATLPWISVPVTWANVTTR